MGFMSELRGNDEGGVGLNLQFQKVIDGLQHHVDNVDCVYWKAEGNEIIPACPYYDDEDNGEPFCETKLLLDAIGLLKEYDIALRMMVYQYCSYDRPEVEYFNNNCMSAGENAFKVLGIENGQEVPEDFLWEER